MRFSLVSLTGALLLLAGCSSMSQEGGIFEDKSRAYVKAKSLEQPVPSVAGYSHDPLYPIPDKSQIKQGDLLKATPRVTSALMPLEQGAILLHKSGSFDRVLFAPIYQESLTDGVTDYLERREIKVIDAKSSVVSELTDFLDGSQYVSGAFVNILITDWASAQQLGYDSPGFLRRLFGASHIEHQYAYFISPPSQESQQEGFESYVVQLHLAHRTRSAGDKKSGPWSFSIAEDDLLGLEVVNFVEDLKREVALASSGATGDLAVALQQDGNELPYLSISERFPIVWEALLDVLPRQNWKIADLDRSKGIIYLEVTDDELLSQLQLKKFQLHLAEGPQVMILSVELNDEQPAGISTGRHVLEVIEKKFEKRNKGTEV